MGNIKVAYTMNLTIYFKAHYLTYEQTKDFMLQNIHCHDVMLSFAKQCTLHSSMIVENTFHFAKLSCKLGQVSLAMIYIEISVCIHFENCKNLVIKSNT